LPQKVRKQSCCPILVQKTGKNYLIRAKWKESQAKATITGPETSPISGQGSPKKDTHKKYFSEKWIKCWL